MSAAPAIVRIAGLSGSTLEPFLGQICIRHLEAREALARELAEARDRLVDLIGRVLPGFSPPLRRFLLQAKRDSFNGRNLRRHRDRPEWAELLRISDGLADRVLGLEDQAEEAGRTFAEVYQREFERERCHLLGTLQDRSFLRGMALGSPELVTKARELAES